MNIEKKLMALKQEIDDSKGQRAKAEGALESLMKQLETEHECDSLAEAEAKLKDMTAIRKKKEDGLMELVETVDKALG